MISSSVNRFFMSNLGRGQTLDQAATQMWGDVASTAVESGLILQGRSRKNAL
jgi:hypothetical protein